MDYLAEIKGLVKQRIKQRVMTTLREMVMEESTKARQMYPEFDISLRNSLKTAGIEENKINEIIDNVNLALCDKYLKENSDRLLGLVPKLAGIEAQKICREMVDMVRDVGIEAGNELIAELSSTT